MSWLVIALLALGTAAALLLVFRSARSGWEAIVAAILVGLAGYALQGRPDLPGAPRAPDEVSVSSSDAMVRERQALAGDGATPNGWLMIADALARHGQYADAASILRGAVDKDPRNGEAWLAMANALVGHAGGTLSPAALYAFREAEAANPASPGPQYFLGLAMARSGQLVAARGQWGALLARTPANAPWRADLTAQLGRLDALITEARREGAIP